MINYLHFLSDQENKFHGINILADNSVSIGSKWSVNHCQKLRK